MEASFLTMFEDIKHVRSLILLLTLIVTDILEQSTFTYDEKKNSKNLALGKLHGQRTSKVYVAVSLIEY